MRKYQLTSATALSLVLTALTGLSVSGQSFGATTISTATTAPVSTSTTGDLTLDTAGTITLTSGTAVTVDSDNVVTMNGKIAMSSSADNSTGILINGGHTTGLIIAGNITVTDNYTATDTSTTADGVLDYPFATGTGRYGIHSLGTTPFNGNVLLATGTVIDVEGNNSYGIRFENNLNGTFSSKAAFTIIGDNSTAISLEKGATGNVYISGSGAVQGQNSKAIYLTGNYGGNVIIDGSFSSTGYATTASTSLTTAQRAALPANDLYQGGPLVTIGGNIANGLLIGSVPVTDTTNSSTDQDGDGLADATQSTAALTQYGSAPAILIGSATSAVNLGPLTYASTAVSPPTVNYGFLIRGTVSASGLYSGVNATGIQIGGLGNAATISNGFGIKGGVSASAFEADATALAFRSGGSTPLLDLIGGTISASTSSDATVSGRTSRAVDISAGASLSAISIAAGSSIYATANGSTGNATAIRDQSNTLTSITNKNIISATITASDDNADGVADAIVNHAIAIDTRSNTVGLTLVQTDTAPTDSTADQAIAAPYIIGDILLGSGNDSITLNGGSVSGDIDFGAGANSFNVTGAGVYLGKMTGAGTVAFDVGGTGTVALTTGTHLNLTTLHVGGTAGLGLTLDTLHPTTPVLAASGAVTFDNGAKFNLTLNNVLLSPTTFTVLTSPSINLGNMKTSTLDGYVPYIYHADLAVSGNNLVANFRLKSQSEAQFSDNEYAALTPVLTAVSHDPGAIASLMSELTKDNFDKIYDQYLPDFSGENLLTLSQSGEAVNHSLSSLTLLPDNDGGQYWLQEYGFHTERKRGDTNGFASTAFSFAGGRETRMGDHSMLGVYLSYTSATPIDNFAIAKEQMVSSDVTVGGYWRMRNGGFKGWAHAGVGFANFESTRELLTTYVTHTSTGKWNGYSYSAGAGASYAYRAGWLDMTPQVFIDAYGLNEARHTETGGGDYFDLTVASRDSKLVSSSALVNFSYNRWFIKPELWLGWRQNISADIADTVANFTGGTPFTLTGGDIAGGGPTAGFRFSADNEYSYFSLEGDYTKLDAYTNYSISLRTRFQF